ncbi:MAG: protein kinase [Acidobacteriota bacterium]
MDPKQDDQPEGKAVGPYRLGERLGKGGMGEVYKAWDKRLERWVAIKHIRADIDSETLRARFRREAWAAARLAHPSIVPIFDILEEDEGDWIVMEFVDGPTLSHRIALSAPLPIGDVIEWTRQIADGLAEAHGKGILHRDLKAENVMIPPSGHVKIVDFGLAKPLDDPGALTLSKTGVIIGTARSMSPEQVHGRDLDGRADLFSLGVLLYEMLTGRSPFASRSPVATMTRLASEPHQPVQVSAPHVPDRLAILLDRLLEKEPDQRPANARVLAAELADMSLEWSSTTRRERSGAFESEGAGGNAIEVDRIAPVLADLERQRQSDLEDPWPSMSIGGAGSVEESPITKPRLWIGPAALLAIFLFGGAMVLVPDWLAPPRATEPASATEDAVTEDAVTEDVTTEPATAADGLTHYRRGVELLDQFDKEAGNLDASIDAFTQALVADPDSSPALAGLAMAYWRKHRKAGREQQFLDMARANAEQAVAVDEFFAAGHVSLGLTQLDLGDLDDAMASFDRVLVLAPGNAMAWRGRGEVHMARGDLEAAEEAFTTALTTAPDNARLYALLGTVHYRAKDYAAAEEAFRKEAELAPTVASGSRNLAAALFAQGDERAAAEALQQAIEISPQPSLYTNLGTILFYQGLYAQANRAFERAIELTAADGADANNPVLWANLGDSYRFLVGKEEEARTAFVRAAQHLRTTVEEQPDNLEARTRYVLYLAKAGDPSVMAELEALASLEGHDANSRYRLVLAHEIRGDRERALAELERAFAAGVPLDEVEREPDLAELRADPDYQLLVARLGLN